MQCIELSIKHEKWHSLAQSACSSSSSSSYKIKEINWLFYLKEFKENMKKKALLLASMGVLACAVGVTALVVGGTGKFGNIQVHAELDPDAKPGEYSVTFNASNTSCEVVDIYGDEHVIFTTTTERGAKVGMFGYDIIDGNISFADYKVWQICFFNNDYLTEMDFDHFTGVKVAFMGSTDLIFASDNGNDGRLTSDVRFSRECVPTNRPRIETEDYVDLDIDSITIYYTC